MKRVTMQDIASEVGVSKTTVSFVLNNTPNRSIPQGTRERVLSAAQNLGYIHHAKNQPATIGLLVRRPAGRLVQAVYALEVMQGLASVLDTFNYQVTLHEVPEDSDFSYRNWAKQNNFAAIAIDNVLQKDVDELQQLAEENNVISISQCNIPGVAYVDVDNVRGAYTAVDYLLRLGHRRVAMVNYASLDHLISNYRLVGYQQALLHYGIPYDEALVSYANFTSESGQEAMGTLLDRSADPPTAVFVASDVVAAGAMQAVRDRELRIPDDISFASFNDVAFARYLTPPLTTGTRNAFQIGVVAGEMIIESLKNNEPLNRSVLMESELIIRGSATEFGSSNRRDDAIV